MTKTRCNKCLFSDSASSEQPCKFDIPELLKNIKTISIVNDFYEIENYRCLYGFSSKQYEDHIEDLKDISIEDIILEKAMLKYYLIVDTRSASKDKISKIVDEINQLSIKPKRCSFILNPEAADQIYGYVKDNLRCNKWTTHIFIDGLSMNHCINIILDTNLLSSDAWCVLFLDANQLVDDQVDKIINNLQTIFIIQQKNFYGVYSTKDSLHSLCLNCSVYKALTSTTDRDILKALAVTPEVILEKYDYEI